MAAELHERLERDRGVYQDIKDLAVKARSQFSETIEHPVRLVDRSGVSGCAE